MGFYALKKDITLWESHSKRTGYRGCHVSTQIMLEEIEQFPNLFPNLNIYLFEIIP
jgi:hypothetical protein